MSRKIYTGLHSTYRPPPAWDGTPPPEGDNLPTLAAHWRQHGDRDGTLESRIHAIIMRRARHNLRYKFQWGDICADAATNAMLALGSGWDPLRGGAVRYVDMTIQNYYHTEIKRLIRELPVRSLDADPSLDVGKKQEVAWEVPKLQWDELHAACSKIERAVLENYRGKKGALADLAQKMGVPYKRLDNAISRLKLKARRLGIMPPNTRKKRAK